MSFIGKLKGNLPMRVFRQYFARIAKCMQHYPHQLASKLFAKGFISEKTQETVKSSTGLTSLQKAEILLRAVDTRNITDETGKHLKKFCKFLAKYQGLKEVSEQMRKKLGRLCTTMYHV